MRRLAPLATVLLAVSVATMAFAAPAAVPAPSVKLTGRTAAVSLPYRSDDGLVWVSATRTSQLGPYIFKGLDLEMGSDGVDVAVFTYMATGPGAAILRFGLVPQGKMLIGPPSLAYKGPVTKTYQTKVSAP